MIVQFNPKLIGISGNHVLSGQDEKGGFWRITLKPGLNDLSDSQIQKLKAFDGLESYTERNAIIFRESATTSFSRTAELEALWESQGYTAISKIATEYGIPKPSAGWKDAIPLIVQYETETK